MLLQILSPKDQGKSMCDVIVFLHCKVNCLSISAHRGGQHEIIIYFMFLLCACYRLFLLESCGDVAFFVLCITIRCSDNV